jgi:hypothetical protein
MWDGSTALQRYFEDGARIFRHVVTEVQTARDSPDKVQTKI